MTFDQWLEREIDGKRMRELVSPFARMVWEAAEREVPGNAAELLAVCQLADQMLRKYGDIRPWYTKDGHLISFADELRGAILRAYAVNPSARDAGKETL